MAGYTGGGSGGAADLVPQQQQFTAQTSVQVLHDKAYRPSVWILDTNQMEIQAEVIYSSGSVTVNFAVSVSGTIYLR